MFCWLSSIGFLIQSPRSLDRSAKLHNIDAGNREERDEKGRTAVARKRLTDFDLLNSF